MAEIRISFRPHEIRLLIGALDAVKVRCDYQLKGGLDSRDFCVYQFALAEIVQLRDKLDTAVAVAS